MGDDTEGNCTLSLIVIKPFFFFCLLALQTNSSCVHQLTMCTSGLLNLKLCLSDLVSDFLHRHQ